MFFKKRNFFYLSRFEYKYINLFNINLKFFNNILYFSDFYNFFSFRLNKLIFFKKKNNLLFILNKDKKKSKSFVCLFRSIISNIILGFKDNYFKKLILFGIGYKAVLQFKFLYLYLGFSHPIIYKVPFGIKVEINSFTEIIISGLNKQKVNEVASKIRSYKKPNPYKGNGIRYFNEKINNKIIKKK